MDRNPKTNGGEDIPVFPPERISSPYGISFKRPSFVSPTDAQLSTGSNWELANNNASSGTKYFPSKAIPIAQIKTRG
ncbi:MAG: hypothetical protein ACLR8P_13890 [Clostridium fessum]